MFACQAVRAAGVTAAIYLFDERPETCIVRSESVGIPMREAVEDGRLLVRQLDPGEIMPGEFAQEVRRLVEHHGTRLIIIDSVIGYFAAMGAANVLVTQLHELLTYLTRNDVLVIMCGAQEGFMSIGVQQAVDVSYLSDTIIHLTFFEQPGELRRAISVIKKKHGRALNKIHELMLVEGRFDVGPQPLREFDNLMIPRSERAADHRATARTAPPARARGDADDGRGTD